MIVDHNYLNNCALSRHHLGISNLRQQMQYFIGPVSSGFFKEMHTFQPRTRFGGHDTGGPTYNKRGAAKPRRESAEETGTK